ncbi:MAG: hypothetical protein RIC06_24475 [Cyclobacteriaceae bacterium]
MIYLYTDEDKEQIGYILEKVEGLSDACNVQSLAAINDANNHVILESGLIRTPLPWASTQAPIIAPELRYESDDLLAVMLCKLGYDQQALQYATSSQCQEFIKATLDLGNHTSTRTISTKNYFELHNEALIAHYTGNEDGQNVPELFENAIQGAPSPEHAGFTAKHYAVFLLDYGSFEKAEELLRKHIQTVLSDKGRRYLEFELINVLMSRQLSSIDKHDFAELKELVWNSIKHFENTSENWAVASLYTTASEITNIERRYSESLGYISKAISIYENEQLPEFLATAYFRKGTLLYTWAQDSNPQFYQSAIDTYNESLKTFTRDDFPRVYADIHHNLAVIYAEMPADEKKKTMWSAFSATSFKESLEFYKKESYPYEYAMVANNYANALLKYPPAKIGDNADKAIYYYLEALDVRDGVRFPMERAHTILNYLEACWLVSNINKTMERARYNDMLQKIKEMKSLTTDSELLEQANAHHEQLQTLGLSIVIN